VAPEPLFFVPYLRDPRFVGRADDLARVHVLLGKGAPVGLRHAIDVGPSGCGVTRIAVEYVHRYRDEYPGGIYWASTTPDPGDRRTLAESLNVLARRMGLYAAPPWHRWYPHPVGEQSFLEHLRDRPGALLVCEDVDEPNDVFPLWRRGRAPELPCRVLFTTRRRHLGLRFESVEVGVLPEPEAVELLRAEDGARDDGAVRALCRTLGLLPLALALAATYLRAHHVSCEAYLALLLRFGDLSAVGPEDDLTLCLSERHKAAMEVVLRSHWEALESPDARRALSMLALLAPGSHVPRRRLELLAGQDGAGDEGRASRFDEALTALVRAGLVEELAERVVRLHPQLQASVLARTDGADALAGTGAVAMAEALGDPERLEQEVFARGASEVMLDLLAGSALARRSNDGHAVQNALETLLHILRTAGPVGWERAQLPGMLIQHAHHHALFERRDGNLAALAESRLVARRLPHLRVRAMPQRWPGVSRNGITEVTVTAEGRGAISTHADGSFTIWELPSGRALYTFPPPIERTIAAPAIAGGGLVGLFASGECGGSLAVWDLTSNRAAFLLEGQPNEQVWNVAISRNGRFAAARTNTGAIRRWDLARGAPPRETMLAGQPHPSSSNARDLAVAEDGRAVVAAKEDGSLVIWSPDEDRIVRTSESHAGDVTSLAIAPGDRRAVSASEDGALKIWDLATGQMLQALGGSGPIPDMHPTLRRALGFPSAIAGMALTEDGGFAITLTESRQAGAGQPNDDNSLTIWDLAAGRIILKLPWERWMIRSARCAITPDRKTIVISGGAELGLMDWVRWDEG
jgi:WD domain, G-beta repeat